MFDKVLNTPLILQLLSARHIVPTKYNWFFKNYQKHPSAKTFIAVFTPNYSDENVGNVKFFKPKDLITI